MSKTPSKSPGKSKAPIPANLIWFAIPADDPACAQKFYGALFGWKITAFPGMEGYWHIDTGGDDASPDGGLLARKHPGQPITNYIRVPSVTRGRAKVVKLGGRSVCPRSPCRGWATSPCARTRRRTRLRSARAIRRRNKSGRREGTADRHRTGSGPQLPHEEGMKTTDRH